MLDLSLLTSRHIMLFGTSFALVYGLIWLLLNSTRPLLRRTKDAASIYYAGVVVLAVVALGAYLVIDDPSLRIGLLAAAFVALLVGIIDENASLRPSTQFVWQVVIAVIAVAWGWTIPYVSHPLQDGIISLNTYTLGNMVLPGSLLAIVWLLLLMNSMNWLDGVDGLAGGVGVVALITLAAVSLLPSVQHEQTLTLALIGAGGILGFVLWNFAPARVYLGTSGSWFLGLYIGLVAILGGGKIVTTLLVLALPVIDLLLVGVQRLAAGQPPWQGDAQRHLHHRLLAHGWRARTVATAGIIFSIILGVAAIMLQTQQKIIALLIAAAMLIVVLLSITPWRSFSIRKQSAL